MVIVINMIITFYRKFSLSHHLTTSSNPDSYQDGTGWVDSFLFTTENRQCRCLNNVAQILKELFEINFLLS